MSWLLGRVLPQMGGSQDAVRVLFHAPLTAQSGHFWFLDFVPESPVEKLLIGVL